MKAIPITHITFELPVRPGGMRQFRGAVIENVLQHKPVFEAAGINTEIFHNHKEAVAVGAADDVATAEAPEAENYYHYPLVQYNLRHRKAGIMGIGPGAQAVQLWLSMAGESISVGGETVPLGIRYHRHVQWKPALNPGLQCYRINKWLPFNKLNYGRWQHTHRLQDKAVILDRIIWGHLFHLAETLGVTINREGLQLYVSAIDYMGYCDCYGVKRLALDITFHTNLNLPTEIGLGTGTTIGFGKVQRIPQHNLQLLNQASADTNGQ